MHFLTPYALAHRLRENILSEREKFGYVIALVVVRLIAELPYRLLSSPRSMPTLLAGMTFSAICSVVGLWVCFATNARGDNKHFLERFICFSVPLSMWLSVLPAYFYLALYLLGFFSGSLFTRYHGLISLIVWVVDGVTFILYFVLLNRLIGIASGASPSKNAPNFAPIASP